MSKIGFVTPPKAATKPSLSKIEKQRLIENLELEVSDRTRHFHGALTDILNSFLVRQESEILRIPKDLRNVKMKDLKTMWGGDWASTLRHLKEETLKGKLEDQRSEHGKKLEESLNSENGLEDKRKRKRAVDGTSESSVDLGTKRAQKTPRRLENPNGAPAIAPKTPSEAKSKSQGVLGTKIPRPLLPTAGSLAAAFSSPFKRLASRTDINHQASISSPAKPSRIASWRLPTFPSLGRETANVSTLPAPSTSDFEPNLPEVTPKFPRMMKEGDVVLSANGSPIANPWSARPGSPRHGAETDEDDENELPDAEALEKAMIEGATPRMKPSHHLSRGTDLPRPMARKRISSIRIRQSISIGQGGYYDPFVDSTPKPAAVMATPTPVRPQVEPAPASPARISSRGAMLRLTTSSGLTIDFDPFTDDPDMVEEELKGKGVEEDVRGQVRTEMAKKVKELRERLASFKI